MGFGDTSNRDGSSSQGVQSNGRNAAGQGGPDESTERGTLFRSGDGGFRKEFLKEVISELVLRKEYKSIR